MIVIFIGGQFMKKIIFKGVATALVTPFKEDGSINFDMVSKLIEFQIENGTQALVICGTTGESPTLYVEEREKFISYVVKKVNKRVPVIVGTGSPSTKHSVLLSKQAESLGADALLIVTPFYNKTSQKGIVDHYSYISKNVNLPIILYNVPSRTGLNILPETYKELSEIENIVSTKEASGDISSVIKTKSLCGDNLQIYSGNDDQTIPIMSVGGIGVISVFSNIKPKESQKIFVSNSKDLLMKYVPLMNALFCEVNPMPVKYAMKLIGFDCGGCRLPLTELSDSSKEKLKSLLYNKY